MQGPRPIPSTAMKAQRSFTVRPHLPEPLTSLDDLARNLRWSWDRPTRQIFASIDPQSWEAGGHDPRRVLAEVSSDRLEQLSRDPAFLERISAATAALDAYERLPRWFQGELDGGRLPTDARGESVLDGHKVGYFSPEFGIAEALPQYSGGLGVLAGDHLKAASDLGVPLVGVGLFYRHGYFRQSLTADGWQQERFPDLDPYALALELCDGVRVELDLAGRTMAAQVWQADVGRVPLYLLDTDVRRQPRRPALVTDRLYGGDAEHRLRQEILLGIGGVRALDALGIDAAGVPHQRGPRRLPRPRAHPPAHRSATASRSARPSRRCAPAACSPPTPRCPAGIDRFPRELIERTSAAGPAECGITVDDAHGPRPPPGRRARRAASTWPSWACASPAVRNGVSALHGAVSRDDVRRPVARRARATRCPIGPITNGVHARHLGVDRDATSC